MWYLPRRIHSTNAYATSRRTPATSAAADQILGSLAAHARISLHSFGSLAGIETRREIGELMDDDIPVSLKNCRAQRRRVEDIDHHRLHPGGAQSVCLGCRARRARKTLVKQRLCCSGMRWTQRERNSS